jgi:ABC-type nitrate/sulfonate/bicarbonate transport system substrate-binding protein
MAAILGHSTRACGRALGSVLAVLGSLAIATSAAMAQASTIRVGHFPNITHVQALVAHHLTRQGKGWFAVRIKANPAEAQRMVREELAAETRTSLSAELVEHA